jgi:hypothetical protein
MYQQAQGQYMSAFSNAEGHHSVLQLIRIFSELNISK